MRLSREMRRLGKKLLSVIGVRAIPLRRNYATKQQRFCVATAALFHAGIVSGLCATRRIDIAGMRRCLQLAGLCVEAMTAGEANVRAMVIDIIEEKIAENGYEWRYPFKKQARLNARAFQSHFHFLGFRSFAGNHLP